LEDIMTTSAPRVGIMSAGDMGSGFGKVLHAHGLQVYTCLAGRSDFTRLRSSESGFIDCPDFDSLVGQIDLFISVLVPSEATQLALEVASAMKRTGSTPVYADLNAIAPSTVRAIEGIVRESGAEFVDGGIIGGPPREGYSPHIGVSGPDTSMMEALRPSDLDIRAVGPDIGQASGLKMVYASSTKGTTALWTELLTAARAMGLEDALRAELGDNNPVFNVAKRGIPAMPNRARRWVGEMEEIARTFQDLGMTPNILQGAADMYALVGETSLADLTSRDPNPTLEEVLDALIDQVEAKS
jgi:3-hydroxyisobutyrate dehydrogenase-like beta-hydroxyacid dehydrogenase